MYVCIMRMYVYMYVCMHACMYLCIYVCIYDYMCVIMKILTSWNPCSMFIKNCLCMQIVKLSWETFIYILERMIDNMHKYVSICIWNKQAAKCFWMCIETWKDVKCFWTHKWHINVFFRLVTTLVCDLVATPFFDLVSVTSTDFG